MEEQRRRMNLPQRMVVLNHFLLPCATTPPREAPPNLSAKVCCAVVQQIIGAGMWYHTGTPSAVPLVPKALTDLLWPFGTIWYVGHKDLTAKCSNIVKQIWRTIVYLDSQPD